MACFFFFDRDKNKCRRVRNILTIFIQSLIWDKKNKSLKNPFFLNKKSAQCQQVEQVKPKLMNFYSPLCGDLTTARFTYFLNQFFFLLYWTVLRIYWILEKAFLNDLFIQQLLALNIIILFDHTPFTRSQYQPHLKNRPGAIQFLV